jgi:putative flippase GtrA
VPVPVRYGLFAALASAINVATQWLVLTLYRGPHAVAAALVAGTLAGIVPKYLLDKWWIFDNRAAGARAHARQFTLYTLLSVVTTLMFWATEIAFHAALGTPWSLYAGAVAGLCLGYWTKYHLDRRITFGAAT